MFNSHRGKPAGGRKSFGTGGERGESTGRGGPRTGGGFKSGGRRGPGSRDKKYTDNDSDRPGFGKRNRGGPEMFRTTCDECGNSCEVPFKPTMGKPVYCRECFDTTGAPERSGTKRTYKGKGEKSGGFGSDGTSGGHDSGSRTGGGNSGSVSTAQFDKLNDKLDKILKLLSEKEEE